MATKRTDVELVIKAADQASKNVQAVTDALRDFHAQAGKLKGQGAGPDEALRRLKDATGNLSTELKQLESASQVDERVAKVAAGLAGMEKQAQETAAGVAALNQQLQTAKLAHEQAEKAAHDARAAFEAEATATAKAAEIFKAAKGNVAETAREVTALTKTQERLAASLAKVEASIDKLRDKQEGLASVIAKSGQASDAQRRRMSDVSAAIAKQQSTLQSINNEYSKNATTLADLVAKQQLAAAAQDKIAQELGKQKAALAQVGESARAVEGVLALTSKAEKSLSADITSATAALEKQQKAAVSTATGLEQMRAAADQVKVAAAEAGARLAKSLSVILKEQGLVVGGAEAAARRTAAAYEEFRKKLEGLRNPTEQQTKALKALRDEASASRQAAKLAADTFGQMQKALSAAGTDVSQLQKVAQEFEKLRKSAQQAMAALGGGGTGQRSVLGRGLVEITNRADAASAANKRTEATFKALGFASREAALKGINPFEQALSKLFGGSRQSLSYLQRLRGELIGVTLQFAGLYAAANQLGQVVGVIRTVEAATSRLNVVFSGDSNRVASELDFIRRTADRLGQEFGTLAQEYSKLAVSSKGTELEGENIRKIFVAVAEAARVNKLSTEQVSGTFLAFQQIISKGKVKLEELQGQLGEHLPGSIQLMADALGVGADKLFKMLENGEVTREALIKLAAQLDKTFSPHLEKSLDTATTAFDRMKNSIFQARLKVAEFGAEQGLKKAADSLSKFLDSAEGLTFLRRAGEAVEFLLTGIAQIPKYLGLILAAVGALLGMKIGQFIVFLIGRLVALHTITGAVTTSAGKAAAMTALMGTSATKTAGAMGVLRGALLAVFSTTGLTVIATAIGTLIGLWASRADDASLAMNSHKTVVDQVKNAYDRAEGSAAKWAAQIKNVTASQAQQNLIMQRAELNRGIQGLSSATELADRIRGAFGADPINGDAIQRSIHALTRTLKAGEISIETYKESLDGLAKNAPTEQTRSLAVALQDQADKLFLQKKAADEAQAAYNIITQGASAAAEAEKTLGLARDKTIKKALPKSEVDDKARRKEISAAEREINDILERRTRLIDFIQTMQEQGDPKSLESAARFREELKKTDAEALKVADRVKLIGERLGDENLIIAAERLRIQVATVGAELFKAAQFNQLLADGAVAAFTTGAETISDLAKGLISGAEAARNFRDAFLTMAADFLLKIGQMIAQQAILNALQQATGSPGGIGGSISGALNALFSHQGSIVGQGGARRMIDPRVFVGAPRYHNGLPGLRSDERPAILQLGEEVLSKNNPRNSANGGGGFTIINTLDPAEIVSRALGVKAGREALINFITENNRSIKGALG